jgi:hypothetical protein
MELPAAIQRQADEAAAAEAAITQNNQQVANVLTDPSQLAPATTPQPAVTPTPEPVSQADDPNSATWQQRFKSLQGMFAQKTGELQAQTRTYESQMANMQKQLDALTQTRKKDEAKERQVVDPKDIENFGADMIEMVQRYAEQVFQSMAEQFGGQVTALDARLVAIEQELTGVTTRTEESLEQQFIVTLTNLVSDWQTINVDPRWLKWLAEVDPIYGSNRQAALNQAREALDAQRVANVFNAFKAAFPAKPQDSLANQVAPSGAATPPQTGPVAAPILSSKFVEKFYNEVAKGRYVGREAEANRIDAEINQAAREGRIR